MNCYHARLMALCAALIVFIAGQGAAEILDRDASVASDGSQPQSTPDASSDESPSFEGTADALPASAADLAILGARPATAADIARLRNAKPRRGGPAAQSIIGKDSRKRVKNTTSFPARATVYMEFSDHDGISYSCSGWLINKNTVVTAGHCVADGNGSKLFRAGSYLLAPGFDGTDAPYGVCRAKRLYTNTTWKNTGADDFDYAAIKLKCSVGAKVGHYGFTKKVRQSNKITVEGYPGDKHGTQWKMSDKVRALDARRVFYRADTFGGQSGAPVWRKASSKCKYCAVAIHAYGVYGVPPYSTNNHGTRINATVYGNLIKWKNAK